MQMRWLKFQLTFFEFQFSSRHPLPHDLGDPFLIDVTASIRGVFLLLIGLAVQLLAGIFKFNASGKLL